MNEFSLTHMAMELLKINEDLPYRFKNVYTKVADFEMYDFEQTWGSTSLGFSGIGGSALTSARTYVFVPAQCEEDCFVYFAGRFAYSVPYSSKFIEDVAKGNVAAQHEKGKYISC